VQAAMRRDGLFDFHASPGSMMSSAPVPRAIPTTILPSFVTAILLGVGERDLLHQLAGLLLEDVERAGRFIADIDPRSVGREVDPVGRQ